MTTTREDYVNLFSSAFKAGEFEQSVLGIGEEFLPECAITVLNDGEPSTEYWAFLANQLEESS